MFNNFIKAKWGLVFLFVTGQALSAVYVDKDYTTYLNKRDKILSKVNKQCTSKNRGNYENCRNSIYDEADAKYPKRGLVSYCEKNYSKFTVEQANQKIVELKAIYDKARLATMGLKKGEITKQAAMMEAEWLQSNILNRPTLRGSNAFVVPCQSQGKNLKTLCEAGTQNKVGVY